MIGIYDADLFFGNKVVTSSFVPNIDAMKISSYYKAQGEQVELIGGKRDLTEYTKTFFVKNLLDGLSIQDNEKIRRYGMETYGLYFSNNIYSPYSKEVDIQKTDIKLYSSYMKQLLINKLKGERTLMNLMNTRYIRMYDNNYKTIIKENRKEDFVYLYDTNFLDYDDWIERMIFLKENSKTVKLVYTIMADGAKQYKDLLSCRKLYTFPENDRTKILLKNPSEMKEIINMDRISRRQNVLVNYNKSNNYNEDFFIEDINNLIYLKFLSSYYKKPVFIKFNKAKEISYNKKEIYKNIIKWIMDSTDFIKLKDFISISNIKKDFIIEKYLNLTLEEGMKLIEGGNI